jgi:galactitol-specific phosphotransferase system IIB component
MKNISLKLKISTGLSFAIILAMGMFTFANKVRANPNYFAKGVSTSTSTSTPTYFQVTATTTLPFDVYQLSGNQPTLSSMDSATVAVQLNATNTSTIMNIRYEYAVDQPGVDCSVTQTACDWYSDNLYGNTGVTVSTTTDSGVSYIPTPRVFSWKYSSSTDFCTTTQTIATNNRGCKLINVPTPTRYVRVVFYLAPGSANGSVYASLVPVREKSE